MRASKHGRMVYTERGSEATRPRPIEIVRSRLRENLLPAPTLIPKSNMTSLGFEKPLTPPTLRTWRDHREWFGLLRMASKSVATLTCVLWFSTGTGLTA